MRFLSVPHKQEVIMSENIYAAPEAEVLDTGNESSDGAQQFYVVSQRKFITLYIATFGLYSIYWHYKNWAYQKEALSLNIWPIPRGIFNLFFVHRLFKVADERITTSGKTWIWNPGLLATGWVVLWLADRILDRLAQAGAISETASLLGVIAMPLMAYIAYQAQCAFNVAENDPTGERNDQFTAANIVWIIVGLLIWTLVGFGVYATFIDL
jgi:hypothetical protein